MVEKRKVFFRADGNSSIGLGHVIRSLALADMLKDDFECHFIIRNPLPKLKVQILECCLSIYELPDTNDHEQEAEKLCLEFFSGNEIVVLDGYYFRTKYQQFIKDKGCKLLCIDDIYSYHFVADIIINHSGGIKKDFYSAEPYSQIFLGLEYALLRPAFRAVPKNKEYNDRSDTIFICLGGADPKNDTIQILKLCEELEEIKKCYLVVGGAYIHMKELNAYIERTRLDITLLNNLSAPQMVDVMRKCSKAITSPSTISFEYLSVGGELYLKMIADNQININHYFTSTGLAFPIEQFPIRDLEKISLAKERQRQIFDGFSNSRLIDVFKSI